MGANPHANGGLLKKNLRLPDFRDYGIKFDKPGQIEARKHETAGHVSARCDEAEHGLISRFWSG